MLKFDSRKILLLVLGILVVLIFFKFFSILSFPDSQTVLDKGDELKIYPHQEFKQTFVANRDGLDKIEFLLRTPGVKEGDMVTVNIADETCQNTLRQGVIRTSFLNTDNLYEAPFPRIANSNGQKYCSTISYQTTNSQTKYLRFFTVANTQENTVLTTVAGEQKTNQSLSMRLVYNNSSVWQDLRELDQRMSQYKPWFLKHYYIASVAVLFVLLSISLIVLLITLPSENKHD